jgi:hypothetical protein
MGNSTFTLVEKIIFILLLVDLVVFVLAGVRVFTNA